MNSEMFQIIYFNVQNKKLKVRKINQHCTDFCRRTNVLFSFFSFTILRFNLSSLLYLKLLWQMFSVCSKSLKPTRSTLVIVEISFTGLRTSLQQNCNLNRMKTKVISFTLDAVYWSKNHLRTLDQISTYYVLS